MSGTHPQRGRRRDSYLDLPPGDGRCYPAFTLVEGDECATLRKLGYISTLEAHVRLVHNPVHGVVAVKHRRGSWFIIEEPQRHLTVEQRSFQGRRARPFSRRRATT